MDPIIFGPVVWQLARAGETTCVLYKGGYPGEAHVGLLGTQKQGDLWRVTQTHENGISYVEGNDWLDLDTLSASTDQLARILVTDGSALRESNARQYLGYSCTLYPGRDEKSPITGEFGDNESGRFGVTREDREWFELNSGDQIDFNIELLGKMNYDRY